MKAHEILESLKQNKNLYLISNNGNKKLWFSPKIPEALSEENIGQTIKVEQIPLPYGHFTPIHNGISGGMSYWQHLGGRCSSATAFIAVSPNHQNKGIVEIEWIEQEEAYSELYKFTANSKYINSFCEGLIKGLQTVVSHPIADIRITIYGLIENNVESNQMAFLNLGQWITEALIIELCKVGFINSI